MKKLFILDLNGTMVNKVYQTIVPLETVRKFFAKMKNQGVTIGLSSDSPLETLQSVASNLGIDGPIIAECGSVLHTNRTTILNPETKCFKHLSDTLVQRLISSQSSNQIVLIGDINRLSRLLVSEGDIIGAHASEAIFVNGLRIASSSFFCLERIQNGWFPSAKLLKLYTDWSMRYLIDLQRSKIDDYLVDSNPDYGICIIHHKNTRKSLAIKPLLESYPDTDIFVIGDSIFDWHGENPKVTHCAVSNASQEYKEKCRFIASKPMTAGVMELIEKISSA